MIKFRANLLLCLFLALGLCHLLPPTAHAATESDEDQTMDSTALKDEEKRQTDRAAAFLPPASLLEKAKQPKPDEPEKKDDLAISATAPLPPSVETTSIAAVSADSTGVLLTAEDGLGALMWQDTPRPFVERLLSAVSLPTNSPALNNLARRLLLTTAQAPNGQPLGDRSLTDIRVEKALALGRAQEAAALAFHAKDAPINSTTLRLVMEASLLDTNTKDLCAKTPDLIKGHPEPEWQKLLVICQLRNNDTTGAMLGIDLMREQKVRDDVFISLVTKNIVEGSQFLPRQLTPMKATTLAVLKQTTIPLPADLYTRPDAAFIQTLVQMESKNELARIALAERAATKGIINGAVLTSVYENVKLTPEQLASAANPAEITAQKRADLFQSIKKETDPGKKIDLAKKFMEMCSGLDLASAMGTALADALKNVQPTGDKATGAVAMTRLFATAGRPDLALGWLKLAQNAAATNVDTATELQKLWPILVLSGLVGDESYAKGLIAWLDASLKEADAAKREKVGSILLLFVSFGYVVPEDAWSRVADIATSAKRIQPPSPVLLERLNLSGPANRKGEAVLLSLLLAHDGASDTPLFIMTDIIKALRLNGLAADAQSLAREAAIPLLETTP